LAECVFPRCNLPPVAVVIGQLREAADRLGKVTRNSAVLALVPVLAQRARYRIARDVENLDVATQQGSCALSHANVLGAFGIGGGGFAADLVRPGTAEVMGINFEQVAVAGVAHQNFRFLEFRQVDLRVHAEVVVKCGRPALHGADDQEVGSSATHGMPPRDCFTAEKCITAWVAQGNPISRLQRDTYCTL